MIPIFSCDDCRRTFQYNATAKTVLLENDSGYEAQNIDSHQSDQTRKIVICPNCKSKNVSLADQGHCTVLKKPMPLKRYEVRELRTKGYTEFLRSQANSWQPEKLISK